jgi:MFS family permease
VNLGWAFLITEMPAYFTARYGVPVEERAWVSTVPVLVGCFGMLAGGLLIDGLTKRFGLRVGRVGPLSGWLVVAAIAYAATSQAPTAWVAACCLGLMAFAVDAANPAYWAFSQDIGKGHAAATLGFGNMIGNVGAALSPLLLGTVQTRFGWPAVFWAGAGAFGMSAVVALFLNPKSSLGVRHGD